MIDRSARNKLAEKTKHFIGCFIDNYEFDDAAFELIKSKDRAIYAIYNQIWFTYDDLKCHKLEGKKALNNEQIKMIKRAIIFLKSDYEYTWSNWPFYYKLTRPLLWLFSFGYITKALDAYFNGFGDLDYWPFFSSREYKDAL